MKSILRPLLIGIALGLAVFNSSAANRTWDGGDLDLPTFWSARTNWNGNTNIATGDALFFPGTALVKTMQNDLTISNFTKLTFNDDGYTLNNKSLRLTNGITVNHVPTGTTRINVGLTLGATQGFEADDASATLELNGPLNVLGFTLTNQGVGTIRYLAPISGTGTLRKREIGTVEVRSTNANFLGTVEISGGDFNVNGRMPAGAITVNSGGTLGGTGLVSTVTANNSGTIAPGGAGRGILNVTNGLTLRPRGIFEAQIFGSTAGLFDQLNVAGAVTLTNAALNLTVNFIPASPTAITIIANDGNDPVLGTFAGLPQGAVVLVTDFIRATISYTGGTGNDVVITVSPLETLTWTGSASALWSVDANWVGGSAPQPGDSLVFPVVAVRKQATNDFAADTVFGLIRYESNYTLEGARAALRRGFHAFHNTLGTALLHLPLKLAATQTFTNQFQDVSYVGGIELGGFGLTFRSGNNTVEHFVNSEISGVGTVTQAGTGQVNLIESNSFTGVLVAQASVAVLNAGALGTPAQATLVETNGRVRLFPDITASSDFAEPLQLSGLLEVFTTNLTWSGNVTFEHPAASIFVATNQLFTLTSATLGTNGFIKDGPGTLRLATIQASHGGTTFVKQGTLQVDTAMTNSALVVSNGATLTGTGTVRQATFLAGSILSPAGDAGGDGSISTLTVTQSLTLQGDARLRVNLDGPAVQRYDQVDVLGTVNLGAGTAILELNLSFIPTEGSSFAILDNDGADAITGTFAGKPQGAVFTANGQRLQISYTAGSGNDIVLTALGPEELTWTGVVNGFWSTPGNWSPARVPQDGDRLIFPGGTPRRFVTNTIGGLDLHSFRFAGAGASNNSFQVFGATLFIGGGIAVTNPVSAEFKMQVILTAPQTLVTRGSLSFDGIVNALQDVTVVGNSTFRTESLFGGPYYGVGGAWELNGLNSIGSSRVLGLSNVFLNYGALQVTTSPLLLTNGTFRLNATNASIRDLLLANSLLDVASANFLTPGLLLRCIGDLEFLGTSRLAFDFTANHQPVVEVTGDVRLNNATLIVSNFNVAFGVPVTVIRNRGGNPVAGIFNGLPEGALLTDANGVQHRISYFGGDSGDDVTLTRIAPVTGLARVWRGAGANGDWSQPANWVANLVPADGDSVEFPDAPKPANTNNLPAVRYNQLRYTGTSGVARVLAPNTNGFVGLQLIGGLDYRDTGTLRIPSTNAGFLNPRGLVQILAPQDFRVATGGTVKVDALIGLPGAAITKTGDGILEVSATTGFLGAVPVPLRVREGTLRVGTTTESLEQTGGMLDVLQAAQDVTLFGGAFQTAPIATNDGVRVAHLDAGGATNLVIIRPGGEGAAGRLTVTNSLTLNFNVTLRMDIANAVSFLGTSGAADDLIDLDDTGDFHFNNARLELNFLPSFKLSPTNLFLIVLSQNARTNNGNFADLPHLGLLTNQIGVLRISYRDFVLPPPFNIFNTGPNQGMVVLERIIARPVMLAVTNGPGAFKTVTALGTPSALYVIEASEDLENWTALGAETASPLNGLFNFTDVTPFEHRFYRARLP